MVSEVSVANKEEIDAGKKVEESEVSKKELVGQAAPLVDVSGKNSNGKVNMFLLSHMTVIGFAKPRYNSIKEKSTWLTLFFLIIIFCSFDCLIHYSFCQFDLILLLRR